MLNRIKSYMMPIAMITGVLLHQYMDGIAFLTPYLIAVMLLITYCDISLKDIHFTRLHLWLILIQVFGSIAVYLRTCPYGNIRTCNNRDAWW